MARKRQSKRRLFCLRCDLQLADDLGKVSMDGIGRGSRQGFQGFQTNPSQSVNLNGQFQCDILDLLVEPEQVVVSDISVVGVADSNVAEVANSKVVSHLSKEVVGCGGGAREGLGKGDSLFHFPGHPGGRRHVRPLDVRESVRGVKMNLATASSCSS